MVPDQTPVAMFGLSFGGRSKPGSVGPAEYLLAGYSVFGMVTAALIALGAGVAMERAQGWLVLKRATPMPVSAYLLSKVLASMMFGAVIVMLLATCAVVLGG
jgi:ABC-2 type transport system permease protein